MAANDAGDNEYIIVQTDTAFDSVLRYLADLRKRGVLRTQTVQEASINNIESANPSNDDRFIFGGKNAGNKKQRIQAFTRTASSVLRMCMMSSANMTHYPRMDVTSQRRNKKKNEVYRIVWPKVYPD